MHIQTNSSLLCIAVLAQPSLKSLQTKKQFLASNKILYCLAGLRANYSCTTHSTLVNSTTHVRTQCPRQPIYISTRRSLEFTRTREQKVGASRKQLQSPSCAVYQLNSTLSVCRVTDASVRRVMFTDRVSGQGNAIGRVRPSVSLFTF